MADLALLTTMFAVCGGIGLPLAYLLPSNYAWRIALAPALGTAVLAVVLPVAYRAGLAIPTLFYVALALACAGWAARARAALRELRAQPRDGWLLAAGAVACTLLLLAPRWIGGEQFAVYRGNAWDTFSYLAGAVVYARKPYDAVVHATASQLIRVPILTLARSQLDQRPSVNLVFALISRVAPGAAYRLGYAYLAGCFAQTFGVAAFAARALVPRAARAWPLVLAAAVPLGFWGQYVLDIDAWSQIAATPLLLAWFTLLLLTVARRDHAWRTAAVLAVGFAGMIYMYPEGSLVYIAATCPVAGVIVLARMIRARRFELRAVIPFVALAGAAAVALYPPLLHFLVQQVKWGSGTRVSWWEYFQAFFRGRDNAWSHGAALAIDFAAGLFGMYFATPAHGAPAVLAFAERAAIAGTIVALVAGIACVLVLGRRRRDSEHVLYAAWFAATLLIVALAAYLMHDENYWAAGKLLSYGSAPLVLLLVVPAAHALTGGWRVVRGLAIAFVAFQLACGVARLPAAAAPDGVHYAAPYPAANPSESKRDLGWDFTGLEPLLSPNSHVLVEPCDVWLENRLAIFLYSRRIPFAFAGKFNLYFGSSDDLPVVAPPWQPDVELIAHESGFTLHDPSGARADVEVASRGEIQ